MSSLTVSQMETEEEHDIEVEKMDSPSLLQARELLRMTTPKSSILFSASSRLISFFVRLTSIAPPLYSVTYCLFYEAESV